MEQNIFKSLCCVLTISIAMSLAYIASQGELLADLLGYNSDKVFFVLLIATGVALTLFVWEDVHSPGKWKSVVGSFFYYYITFCTFSDGHVAGWSHSKDVLSEKFLVSIMISLIYLISIIVPLLALLIGFINTLLIQKFVKFNYSY